MRNAIQAIAFTLLLAFAAMTAGAATVTGYNITVIPPQTDIFVSIPFVQRSEGTFSVVGTTANAVTVAGPLNVNQFQATYYVRFTSGASNGRWSTITANDATSFTVEDTSILTGVVAGDAFRVHRHQTLGSVFPDNYEGFAFKKSASQFSRSTELLIPNSNIGINKSASTSYYFLNGAWRKSPGSAAVSVDNDILVPQRYFIFRNRDAALSLNFVTFGDVETNQLASRIPIEATKNDIPTGTGQAVPVRLSQLDLGGTGAFVNSASQFNRGDELLVFPTTPGFNKSATTSYYFLNNAWRKSPGSATVSADAEILPAGAAFIFRKSVGTAGSSVIWTQPSPN